MKVLYVPGRKWHLSLAEIRSVFSAQDIPNVELLASEDLCVYDVQAETEVLTELFPRLGGFIKWGRVIEEPFSYLEDMFGKDAPPTEEKINFAVSFYGASGKKAVRERTKLGITVKKWLRERGYKARFVAKQSELETSTVLMDKNKVFDTGFELVRFTDPKRKETIWGMTADVQDYEAFSKRDYDRPRANKEKGMLPPKLARMMVNFSQTPEDGIIWDPFCGSGTVLMEALALGYKVVGTDVDPTAIAESKENLKWLCDEKWISHNNYEVFEHDITKGIPKGIDFTSIVTEPYLGPVLRDTVNVSEIEGITAKITPLFDSILKIASEKGREEEGRRMVIVVPGFKTQQGWIDMDPLGEDPSVTATDETPSLSKHPLQWDRPNSIIRRNIKILAF